METDFPPSGNRYFFVQRFFRKLSLKQVEPKCKRKSICNWLMQLIIWLVNPIFFYFLRQQSTAASGNSSFFNWSLFFRQSFNPTFTASGNYYWKLEGSQFLKTKYIPASEHQFFQIIRDFKIFKVEATFPYSGNAFFNSSFIRLVETDFLSSGNRVFWSELLFC